MAQHTITQHRFSVSPLGIVQSNQYQFESSEITGRNWYLHVDYMYRVHPKFLLRVGLNSSETGNQASSRSWTYADYERHRGFMVGFHFQPDTIQVNRLHFSFGMQLIAGKNIRTYERTTSIDSNGIALPHARIVDYIEEEYTVTGSRFSLYLEMHLSKHFYAYVDPAIVVTQEHKPSPDPSLLLDIDNNRILGFGIRW